jgi:hypothetical protein
MGLGSGRVTALRVHLQSFRECETSEQIEGEAMNHHFDSIAIYKCRNSAAFNHGAKELLH